MGDGRAAVRGRRAMAMATAAATAAAAMGMGMGMGMGMATTAVSSRGVTTRWASLTTRTRRTTGRRLGGKRCTSVVVVVGAFGSARGDERRAARERRREENAKSGGGGASGKKASGSSKGKTAQPTPTSRRDEQRGLGEGARARAGVVVKRRSVRDLGSEPDEASATVKYTKSASRDPTKAAEEREKLWARLGATGNGGGGASYAHLLDPGAPGMGGRSSSTTRGRGSNRAALRLGYAAHRERFAKALKCELEEEMELAEKRLNTWTLDKLIEEGYAILGMRARYEGVLQRDALVRLTIPLTKGPEYSPLGQELPYHRFTTGDMVTLSEGTIHDATNGITGVIALRSMHFLTLSVHEDDLARLIEDGSRWRLDLTANTVAHDRSLEALVAFSEPGGMPGVSMVRGERKSTTAYATLQRSLLGVPDENGTLEELANTPPAWAGKTNKTSLQAAIKEVRDPLNPSQRVAVKSALSQTLSIWQGPPGTGKTRTLIAYIGAAVHLADAQGRRRNGPTVLASAASNVAVDNILEGLAKESFIVNGKPLRIVRLGAPAKVQPWLQQLTLDAQIALHPLGRQAASIRESIRGKSGKEFARLRKQATQLELTAAKSILKSVDVVCATTVGAGDELLSELVFPVAVVDEATQCTEPGALIPVTKALTAVLVGDSKQLPPTVVSRAASDAGLQVSLFERMERLGVEVCLLDQQYRMHPKIAEFPSLAFYEGRVGSVPTSKDRPLVSCLNWPEKDVPVAFVEIAASESRAPDGNSLYNAQEAEAAIAIVKKLIDSNDLAGLGDIGIISPYAAQVRLLQEEYAKVFPSSRGDQKRNYLDYSEEDKMDELEIRSVDGFQGREKEMIILCTVRSNTRGEIGFVADPRRLNVGITRAKRGLVVLGNRHTLSVSGVWRDWFKWVDKNKCTLDEKTSM